MKQLSLAILGIFAMGTVAFANPGENSSLSVYNVETSESKVTWLGKKVTGAHNGTLALQAGEVHLEGNKVVNASVKMDMNTIVCEDLTDAQWNKKLVDHLKSDDFFSVEKFPTASFSAISFTPRTGQDAKEFNYTVKGNLTIKGITHEITFPARVDVTGGKITANGTAKLDRTKWDIKYGSGSFFKGLGDNMIYDEFEIGFELVAKSAGV